MAEKEPKKAKEFEVYNLKDARMEPDHPSSVGKKDELGHEASAMFPEPWMQDVILEALRIGKPVIGHEPNIQPNKSTEPPQTSR
jgi:hypothetical protein